jgi:hypothetical protein
MCVPTYRVALGSCLQPTFPGMFAPHCAIIRVFKLKTTQVWSLLLHCVPKRQNPSSWQRRCTRSGRSPGPMRSRLLYPLRHPLTHRAHYGTRKTGERQKAHQGSQGKRERARTRAAILMRGRVATRQCTKKEEPQITAEPTMINCKL